MSVERKLKFRIRRGDYEVELEGEFDYVKQTFEEVLESLSPKWTASLSKSTQHLVPLVTQSSDLQGIVEITPEGKPHLTVPVDAITAKEAVALVLYSVYPNQLSDKELSNFLSSSWKTTKEHVVRARASELRKEGRLIAQKGRYSLSGAGIQWIRPEVIKRLTQP